MATYYWKTIVRSKADLSKVFDVGYIDCHVLFLSTDVDVAIENFSTCRKLHRKFIVFEYS